MKASLPVLKAGKEAFTALWRFQRDRKVSGRRASADGDFTARALTCGRQAARKRDGRAPSPSNSRTTTKGALAARFRQRAQINTAAFTAYGV